MGVLLLINSRATGLRRLWTFLNDSVHSCPYKASLCQDKMGTRIKELPAEKNKGLSVSEILLINPGIPARTK
jgi:hypothetical protein